MMTTKDELLGSIFSIHPGKHTIKFGGVPYSQDRRGVIAHSNDPIQVVGTTMSSVLIDPQLLMKCIEYLSREDKKVIWLHIGGQHQPVQLSNRDGESMLIATYTQEEKDSDE